MIDEVISAFGAFETPAFSHEYPFNPTYGYSYEQLLEIVPPVKHEDFENFWRGLHKEALLVSTHPQVGDKIKQLPHHWLYEVNFASVGRVEINGWIAIPKHGDPKRAVVVGHGYGGRQGVDEILSMPDAVYLFPCLRGLSLSSYHGLEKLTANEHVLWGIESRDTYIHGECAADLWCAATALLELYPETEGRLGYRGGSFGGGMGALMLPWDSRFKVGWLEVPSFSNHPLRVQAPCVGSGQSVREYWLRKPHVLRVLSYFDSVTAASFIKIPMYVVAALFDPAVPPFGQFGVYNAIESRKKLCVVSAGHFNHSNEAKEWNYAQELGNRFLEQNI